MAGGKFVAYYRVSTERQGRSGLGLDAQREAVRQHLNGGKLAGEVVEIESGKRNDRPKLAETLRICRLHGAILIIAKLDRLARVAAPNEDSALDISESGPHYLRTVIPMKFRARPSPRPSHKS